MRRVGAGWRGGGGGGGVGGGGGHTYRVKINRGTDFWQQWAEQCITLETGKEAAAWS